LADKSDKLPTRFGISIVDDDFDNRNWVHFSPYGYVERLGKSYQLAIDKSRGGIDDVEAFVESDLGSSLERDGLGRDDWIATHVVDVLSKIQMFREHYPNATKVIVKNYALRPAGAE
jgi:hypothetical protein